MNSGKARASRPIAHEASRLLHNLPRLEHHAANRSVPLPICQFTVQPNNPNVCLIYAMLLYITTYPSASCGGILSRLLCGEACGLACQSACVMACSSSVAVGEAVRVAAVTTTAPLLELMAKGKLWECPNATRSSILWMMRLSSSGIAPLNNMFFEMVSCVHRNKGPSRDAGHEENIQEGEVEAEPVD